MRESVGSTWIFTLIITFTLIFAGFLVLAMQYSKTYKIKNEMTSIIEKYEGLTYENTMSAESGSIDIINSYLKNSNYQSKGSCNSEAYCAITLDDKPQKDSSTSCYYCIESPDEGIFRVTVFFDFNLPIFGKLHQFQISGDTNQMVELVDRL